MPTQKKHFAPPWNIPFSEETKKKNTKSTKNGYVRYSSRIFLLRLVHPKDLEANPSWLIHFHIAQWKTWGCPTLVRPLGEEAYQLQGLQDCRRHHVESKTKITGKCTKKEKTWSVMSELLFLWVPLHKWYIILNKHVFGPGMSQKSRSVLKSTTGATWHLALRGKQEKRPVPMLRQATRLRHF